ncbi:hypothetical protein RLOatenuis_0370 [Rickettsiales bacterium]|nr:hypothetical protein RLOatenuis_0370 [Rickettsiales bacterium]
MLYTSNEYEERGWRDENSEDTKFEFEDQQDGGGDSASFKGETLFTRKDAESGEKQEESTRELSDAELSELKKLLEEYDKLQKRELIRLLELLRIMIILENYINQQEEMRATEGEKVGTIELMGTPLQDFWKGLQELQMPQVEEIVEEKKLRGTIEGTIQVLNKTPHSSEIGNKAEPSDHLSQKIKEDKGLGRHAAPIEHKREIKITTSEHPIKEDAEQDIVHEDPKDSQNLQSAFIALRDFQEKRKKKGKEENILEEEKDAIELMFEEDELMFEEDEWVSPLTLLFAEPDTEMDEVSAECVAPQKEQEAVLPFSSKRPG